MSNERVFYLPRQTASSLGAHPQGGAATAHKLCQTHSPKGFTGTLLMDEMRKISSAYLKAGLFFS